MSEISEYDLNQSKEASSASLKTVVAAQHKVEDGGDDILTERISDSWIDGYKIVSRFIRKGALTRP